MPQPGLEHIEGRSVLATDHSGRPTSSSGRSADLFGKANHGFLNNRAQSLFGAEDTHFETVQPEPHRRHFGLSVEKPTEALADTHVMGR